MATSVLLHIFTLCWCMVSSIIVFCFLPVYHLGKQQLWKQNRFFPSSLFPTVICLAVMSVTWAPLGSHSIYWVKFSGYRVSLSYAAGLCSVRQESYYHIASQLYPQEAIWKHTHTPLPWHSAWRYRRVTDTYIIHMPMHTHKDKLPVSVCGYVWLTTPCFIPRPDVLLKFELWPHFPDYSRVR